jgi:hypothetical protein
MAQSQQVTSPDGWTTERPYAGTGPGELADLRQSADQTYAYLSDRHDYLSEQVGLPGARGRVAAERLAAVEEQRRAAEEELRDLAEEEELREEYPELTPPERERDDLSDKAVDVVEDFDDLHTAMDMAGAVEAPAL